MVTVHDNPTPPPTGGIASLLIVLEHDIDEQYSYTPGEIMKGRLVLKLSENQRVRSIVIEMVGEGIVSGDPMDNRNKATISVTSNSETYVRMKRILIGDLSKEKSQDEVIISLNKGTHELAFSWQLPESLPSSFIGKYGSVSYLIRVVVDLEKRSGICTDLLTVSEPFMVQRPASIAASQLLPEQLVAERCLRQRLCKASCSCFGYAHAIKANVSLHRTAFAPGESVHLSINVLNHSPYVVTALHGAILMKARYHVGGLWTTSGQVIGKASDTTKIAKWRAARTYLLLNLPRYIPESGLPGCSIMDVAYYLTFVAEVNFKPQSRKSLRMEYPITIGHRSHALPQPPATTAKCTPLTHRNTEELTGEEVSRHNPLFNKDLLHTDETILDSNLLKPYSKDATDVTPTENSSNVEYTHL